MKKIICLFLVICFSFQSFALDPKAKAVGTMAAYGTVGGALLGTASLAFGASGRSIAKGASLGLYGGLLFGIYVVTSYELKKRGYNQDREEYYPDSNENPYDSSSDNFEIQKSFIQERMAESNFLKEWQSKQSSEMVYSDLIRLQF